MKILLSLLLTIVLATAACTRRDAPESRSPRPEESSPARPTVYTTFYPTQYFTQRIAGDLIDVVCPVPPGEDAIFWKPDEETLTRYQQADLIVLNGAGFAKWVAQATLPESRIVDTAKPFTPEFITFEGAVVHRHGPGGEHSHEGIDGHTWVDPVNARTQAEEIRKALAERWPDHREAFAEGFASLATDLDRLDAELRSLSPRAAEVPVLASHPAYNYIARRYGWNIHNLDLDPETMPDDATLDAIRRILADFPASILLWEAAPTPEIAARFQSELNLTSEVFSPCELMDPSIPGDYLTVMDANLATLRRIFR